MFRLLVLAAAAAFPLAMGTVSAQEADGTTPAPVAPAPVAPAPVRPRALGPEALVKKSLRDISRGDVGAAVGDDIKALRRGPLLSHGNYCGIGNRPGTAPIDALDAACMRHDACTKTGTLPGCACNERLRTEAAIVAQDPNAAPDEKISAAATASAMALLLCKNRGKLEVPILPSAR